MRKDTAAVRAMSGGVDSSVAAALALESGLAQGTLLNFSTDTHPPQMTL